MKARTRKSFSWVVAILMAGMASVSLAADVDVFAEGAYSFNRGAASGKLVVYIYANVNTDPLCSYSVNLSYNASKLNSPVAEKNITDWYFGASSPGYPYMDPQISNPPGYIIFIGGKLDTDNPTEGVTGQRKLLGKVTFTRSDNNDPKSDAGGPAGYFGVALALGKDGDYDNFVTVGGAKKDLNTAFSQKIVEAGDANGNGTINATDAQRVGQIYNGTSPWTIFADCNLNGTINATDAQCIGQKYNGTYY